MALKKKDFIEVEFTGKVKDGEVFDSNIKKELEKIGSNVPAKPFVFCLGEGMFLKGIDDFLIGKEIGKHKIELSPENAFGSRNSQLIQLIPMKVFREQNTQPAPGAMFNFDGKPAKILSVSGGRVMADFNNPLAGKDLEYNLTVKRKIENTDEKIKSLIDFFFRQELKFKAEGKKIILEVDKPLIEYAKLFQDKFKDMLGLELEAREIKDSSKKSQ
jgi:FKBP-type peptidyl-prolyl cis-trans isomerase 2